jgi:CRP-like cAMP-binding protein
MVKTDTEREWLAKVGLFQGIRPKALSAIRDSMSERTFRQGEVIVAEGEGEGRFFLITEGSATATIGGTAVATFGPGDYFGEISLIDGGPRTATVRADTAVETLTLAPFNFRPILESNPEMAHAILVEMCRRLRDADKRSF